MSCRGFEDKRFDDAVLSLLSLQHVNENAALLLQDSFTTVEEYLRQALAADGASKKTLRDFLASSIRNCQQWEKLTSILTSGMEQRRCCFDDTTGPTQEMTQETWPYNSDDIESFADRQGMDNKNDHVNQSSDLPSNAEISLVPTSILAASIYAQLLSFRGALAVGIVSMDAVTALANVINRWKVECCSFKKTKGKSTKVSKQVKRLTGKLSHQAETADMDLVDEFESLPVKRSRRIGSSKIQVEADFLESEDDEEIPNTYIETLHPRNLIRLGLQLAQAICHIPLQNEFSNSWKMEAIEIIISCVTTVTATLQALVSNQSLQDEIGINGLQQKVIDTVQTATSALASSILVSDDTQMVEENNMRDDESDTDENDVVSSLSSLSRRHDITVATLRGLFPLLSMKEILPMGESGKIAAAQLASKLLENFIRDIRADIQVHPDRWPKQFHSTNKSSFTLTTRPSTIARPIDTASPATPQLIGKHLRSIQNGLSDTKSRNSTTPRVKCKTPALIVDGSIAHFTYRPGPVLSALVGILQQMSTIPGLENATLRTSILGTIHRCVEQLPTPEQTYFMQFIVKLCHSKLPVHRLVASDLIGEVLSEDWIWKLDGDWDELATSLGVMSPHTPGFRNNSVISEFPNRKQAAPAETLFGALKGRLSDRTPTIRSNSAVAITNLCRRVLTSEFDDSMTKSTFLHVLSDHMYDLLEVLRDGAISDDKSSVRRATLIALVDLHILCISVDNEEIFTCSINEQDVVVISAACQDTSLMVRRAAAEGLTTLIERVGKSSSTLVSRTILLSLEKAWATLIIPMVLDSETSCVSKAVELVERLLLLPITSNQDSMSDNHNHIEMATTVAWRILANVGVGTSVGSVRSENDALHKAIQRCMMVNVGKANHQYTESIFQTIHQTAVNSLISPVDNVFAPNISDQRTGVWCLFNSVIGKEAIPKEIIRSLKKSKIDMTFLCTSWDDLLKLFLDRQTPQDNKAALQHSMRCCLHILSQVAMLVDCDTVEHTTSKLQDLLEKFVLPPEIIGSAVDAMIAIKIASRNGESRRDQCKTLLRSIYRSCEKVLSSMRFDVENTSRVSRILFTIGEVSIVGFSASDDDTDDGSKTAVENSQTGMIAKTLVRGICERPSKQLIEYVQAFMTDTLPVGIYNNLDSTPESVRAHAFVALGKLCLRDVNLAQQSLNVLARELHDSIESKNWAVQSNALIVLGDLCVKYTNMVDRFLPVMASCLQAGITTLSEQAVPPFHENGSSLVRKHAILLLSSLILQDYVKWRGLLFHRFLVASVDENDEVSCLAEMVLLGPLLSKQPRLFANQFVESIFVLNCCSDHPIFKAAAAMGDGGSGITVGFDGINLNGDSGRMKRMQMYQMMLSKMSDEDKIGVTARIGKEILGGALKIGSELNTVATTMNNGNATSSVHDAAFNVLSDALSVLQCHQIRVGRSNRSMEDDIEDPNVSTNNAKRALAAKGRLLSNVSRKHLIEILMPILCNLKAMLEKSRSPLLKDLMICLLDVYQRHKNEARECLANDPTTLQEIEYDAQQQLKMQRKSIRER